MSSKFSTTIANVAGTCAGTVVGAVTQEYLAPKTVSGLKSWMRTESTKVEVATRTFLGDYSNAGFKERRLMDIPVTNLVYELLTRQQGDQSQKKNKFVGEDYDNISKVLICDPNTNYFVRNLEEYEQDEKRRDDAALVGIGTGTAASAAVTTGVSEVRNGISLSDMIEKAPDYTLSTVVPGASAITGTKLFNSLGEHLAKNKTEKFNSKIEPQPINTIVAAKKYESELSENLEMMEKQPSETDLQKANILLHTSSNYLVFMEDFIYKKYELDINRKTDLIETLKTKTGNMTIEINSQKDDVREKTRILKELNRDMRDKKKTATMTDLGKLSTAQDRLNESTNKLYALEEELERSAEKRTEEKGFLSNLENKREEEIELIRNKQGQKIVKLIGKLKKYKSAGFLDKIGDIFRSKKLSSGKLSSGGSKTRKRRRTRKMRKQKTTFRKSRAKKRGKSQKAR